MSYNKNLKSLIFIQSGMKKGKLFRLPIYKIGSLYLYLWNWLRISFDDAKHQEWSIQVLPPSVNSMLLWAPHLILQNGFLSTCICTWYYIQKHKFARTIILPLIQIYLSWSNHLTTWVALLFWLDKSGKIYPVWCLWSDCGYLQSTAELLYLQKHHKNPK